MAKRAKEAKHAGDPLGLLGVIDRLEIGPVRVEPGRLTMPYRVVPGRREDRFDLIYRYEDSVFEPGEAGSENLASLVGAQVALNYGLFCREIVFRGPFDEADRRILSDMMDNTSREIYVKKFLEENPFLTGKAARLPVVRMKRYTRAEVSFPDAVRKPSARRGGRSADGSAEGGGSLDRAAVLSSGGKDSLLSYGLLDELGLEVHPVFVNESGRHWYTALNAYRHFSENVPHTVRIWTNADRLFTWMLRHLPFIRKDFAGVRSDEYPIRLWTVAVFLFGALPVLRARGIEHIVIGDEYDTTRRLSYRGVTHYDGLYDQSRYFDNALSRFYRRKGWNLVQFSIIRSLAELLIEKILVERYPGLQRHQMSCHAAHIEGERVHPCGRCEKCRRIVGMLLAFGADPVKCDYRPEQIERCLADISSKGLHQEVAAVEHLLFLLRRRGLIVAESSSGKTRARLRPEILHVRVDPERSPPDDIPPEIRESLYQIFLDHALGVVERKGRSWVPLDTKKSSLFASRRSAGLSPTKPEGIIGRERRSNDDASYLLGHLTWPQAQERFREVDLVLLPVGSIEQHGPHLPLDTDAFDAQYLAEQVALKCKDPKPLVLPLIPYGVSYHHEGFSGTVSVSPDTLSRLVYEVGMSCARYGAKKLVIINGHGGNVPALQFASQMINRDASIFTCVESGETSETDVHAITETPNDVHAGEIETSTTLAVRPDLVDLRNIRRFVPRFSSRYLNFSSKRSVEWYARTEKISKTGVMGDPTRASRDKGERIWELMIERLVDFVEGLKGMTLEEIYQKRY